MNHEQIKNWLLETDPARLSQLWQDADQLRADNVGSDVHLRGLIEISNICSRGCLYCGLAAYNSDLKRYRLSQDEILDCTKRAIELGYGTVVIQSGEDKTLDPQLIADTIKKIKALPQDIAITLSLGEWDRDTYKLWKDAGAERYLLRFETSDRQLFETIHPGSKVNRLELLEVLQELGYETGSGVMVGIPGQSYDSLAKDIEMFSELGLDMIGLGPFIASDNTPLGNNIEKYLLDDENQVPATAEMALKVVALTRITCRLTNIPATTAMATLDTQNGYELGLQAGANVIMPNLTPGQYREYYMIYPGKANVAIQQDYDRIIRERIANVGRTVSVGKGSSKKFLLRSK